MPVTAPCLLLRHKTGVESSPGDTPGLNSGSSGAAFLLNPTPRAQEPSPEPWHHLWHQMDGEWKFSSSPPRRGRESKYREPGEGLAGGGSRLPGEGKKGGKSTWECGKIFLFLLFFCLETTVWCWQCLNTGCVVSLSCCRSVNSVSGKSPLTPSCLCSPRHFQCQALLGLNPDQLPNPMARGHKSPILGPAGTGPVLGAVFVPRGRRQV